MLCLHKLLVLVVVALAVTGFAACHSAPPPEAIPAPTTGTVPVDDVQIHYEIHGDGTALILLHGGLGNAGHWDKQIPTLSKRYKVIAVDSRGHGRSTYSERPITYSLMASDVVAVMDALGIEKADVLGWSDGANTGLDLAVNNPDRLIKVIAFGGNFDQSGARADFPENAKFLRYIERASADYQRLSPNPKQWGALLANLENMWASEPHFTSDQLDRISVPILILDGDNDEAVYTDHTRKMAALIPTATLTLISGTGHFAHWEKPEEFNKITLQFLDK
jgi:pimeloyl-ACP methyl ester carboxylesterase